MPLGSTNRVNAKPGLAAGTSARAGSALARAGIAAAIASAIHGPQKLDDLVLDRRFMAPWPSTAPPLVHAL